MGYTWLGHTQHDSPPLWSPGPLGGEVKSNVVWASSKKKECEGKKIIHVTALLKQNNESMIALLLHMLHTVMVTHGSHL